MRNRVHNTLLRPQDRLLGLPLQGLETQSHPHVAVPPNRPPVEAAGKGDDLADVGELHPLLRDVHQGGTEDIIPGDELAHGLEIQGALALRGGDDEDQAMGPGEEAVDHSGGEDEGGEADLPALDHADQGLREDGLDGPQLVGGWFILRPRR